MKNVAGKAWPDLIQRDGRFYSYVNSPPVFSVAPSSVSLPSTGGTIQFTAADPNGQAITYSLPVARAGITINASSGLVTVAATAADSTGKVTVAASDGVLTTTVDCSVSVAAASTGTGIVMFQDGFEASSIDFNKWNESSAWLAGPDYHETSTDRAREGTRSLKSYCAFVANSANKQRVELARVRDAVEANNRWFKDTWYGWSTYFDYGANLVQNRWEIFAQWHNIADAGDATSGLNPPLSFSLQNGGIRCIGRYSTSNPTTTSTNSFDVTNILSPNLVQSGKWYDFVVRVRWDYRKNADGGIGRLTTWVDGNQVHNYSGPIGYNDERQPYLKIGIYADPNKLVANGYPARLLYHDCVRVGDENSNYSTVAPR